eukprot:m.110066 g.110066  ORF g.110066 m.110066 type:complete len:114 (-) comp13385_c0_seq2:987-1328(-)
MRYPDMPDVELCIQMALFLRSPAVFPPPSNWQYVRQSEPLPDVSDQVLGEQDESALLPLFTQEVKQHSHESFSCLLRLFAKLALTRNILCTFLITQSTKIVWASLLHRVVCLS